MPSINDWLGTTETTPTKEVVSNTSSNPGIDNWLLTPNKVYEPEIRKPYTDAPKAIWEYTPRDLNSIPSELSQRDEANTHLNTLQQIIDEGTNDDLLTRNFITKGIGNALDTIYDTGVDTIDRFKKYGDDNGKNIFDNPEIIPEKFGKGISAITGGANLVFSPFSASFKAAEATPIVGDVIKDFNELVGQGMELSTDVITDGIDMLPISDNLKTNLAKPIAELATLIGTVELGKRVHSTVTKNKPLVEAKLKEIKNIVTKDIIETHKIPEVVHVPASAVKDIWQTGKILTEAEKQQVLSVIGKTNKDIIDATKNGVSISIPAENITYLVDKPYWSKIKEALGIKGTPEIIKQSQELPTKAPRGLLETPIDGQISSEIPTNVKSIDTWLNDGVEKVIPSSSPIDVVQPIDNTNNIIYNDTYGKETTNQLNITEGSSQREKIQQFEQRGTGQDISGNSRPDYKGLANHISKNPDGFTISIGGKVPTKGYVVSPYKGRETILDTITGDSIKEFLLKNEDLLSDSEHYFGGWKNKEDGKFYLDVSVVKDSLNDAHKIAKDNEQISIYDLGKGEEIKTEDINNKKTSKIALDINKKAIESKLTEGFKELAGYDPITIKEQTEKATKLIEDNMEKVTSILKGNDSLPEGLKGTALIVALEEYLLKNPNKELAYLLANSDIVSGTSEAAQELRLAAERKPDSATAKIQEIKKSRTRKISETKRKETKEIVKKIKESTEKVNLEGKDLEWDNFLDSIKC